MKPKNPAEALNMAKEQLKIEAVKSAPEETEDIEEIEEIEETEQGPIPEESAPVETEQEAPEEIEELEEIEDLEIEPETPLDEELDDSGDIEPEKETKAQDGNKAVKAMQEKLVTVHGKYKKQRKEFIGLQKQHDQALAIINARLDIDLKGLSSDDLALLDDIATGSDAVSRYSALTLLKKHNKISSTTQQRIPVDRTRVSTEAEHSGRPRNPAEARRNVLREMRKIANT